MRISILGCGWLGLPAGRHFSDQGHHTMGSTTRKEKLPVLKANGIEPFLIRLGERVECILCEPFWNCDLLVLNIPPGRSRGDVLQRHPKEIKAVRDEIRKNGIQWVIFASSTSVYGRSDGWKREEDAESEPASSDSGEALLKCEKLLLDSPEFDTTVIRFGGLYGYDRHPARNLAGRRNLKGGDRPVNLIHRDDCLQILDRIVRQDQRNEIFNAVSDHHPTRGEFYRTMARRIEVEPPHFSEESARGGKIISNEKLKRILKYRFLYPDPSEVSP